MTRCPHLQCPQSHATCRLTQGSGAAPAPRCIGHASNISIRITTTTTSNISISISISITTTSPCIQQSLCPRVAQRQLQRQCGGEGLRLYVPSPKCHKKTVGEATQDVTKTRCGNTWCAYSCMSLLSNRKPSLCPHSCRNMPCTSSSCCMLNLQ